MTSHNRKFSFKPNSLESKFTKGFLPSLIKINKQRSISPFSFSCSKRIKFAADVSMAVAVGPRKAWSRAVLKKIQNRVRRRIFLRRIRTRAIKRRREVTKKMMIKGDDEVGFGRTELLRKLVPGGEKMDICNLLDETAHYMKCLTTQVQVMQSLVDIYSS